MMSSMIASIEVPLPRTRMMPSMIASTAADGQDEEQQR